MTETWTKPASLYHAYTSDPELFSWSFANGGVPVLTRTLPWELSGEQVADPVVQQAGNMSYMFYDAVNNAAPSASIGIATFAGPLSAICP